MKKITLVGITIAAAMALTACQKERLNVVRSPGRLVKETFSADIEQNTTKSTISDDAKTVNWAANDTIHYYTADGGPVRRDTIKTAGSSATLNLFRETGDTYYNLVYSGSAAPTFTTKTGKSMVFDGVKSSQDGTFSNANVSVGRTTPGAGGSITFKPVTALVKFTTARTDIKTIVLTGGLGTETIAGNVSVDPTAASPKATLSETGSTGITVTIGTPAAGTYYVNVLPVKYANGLKMTLKNSGGGIIGTVTASNSIDLSAGGKMINLGNIDSHIVLDAIDLSASGTANCYIVSEAGKYKFKAAKGNSITPISGIASVAVLWESYGTDTAPTVGDLIKTDISYADGYITFTTGSQFPANKGNAVIAAYDAAKASGDILWSWHIWMTDVPASHIYNNSAGTVMDRNLGATSATPGDVHALGLLYQWGRKDPFLGCSSISSDTEAKSTGEWPSATTAIDSLDYVEKHPMQFITGNYGYESDWLRGGDSTRWERSTRTKGKYDPCPHGWRVPDNKLWWVAFGTSEITQGPWDETNRGMNFGSSAGTGKSLGTTDPIWYPATGSRSFLDGSLSSTGMGDGYYCSAEVSKDPQWAIRLQLFGNGQVSDKYLIANAEASSVRCISESSRPTYPPTVTTSSISFISETSITCGGNVTADGGTYVTTTGLVWSTSPNPTVDSHIGMTTDGEGIGSFTGSLTGLSYSTTYYVRAYATNAAGTSYGEQKKFTTQRSGPATDLSTSGTANCYVVSQAEKYKFKATVQGNTSESVGTPSSAEILWESFGTDVTPNIGDIIIGAFYSDGYITFSTPTTLNNGNAVIAVKNASGTILWSWHIWVCSGFNPETTAQKYNNNAGTMMDRNLGATSATPGDVHALGLLYQWGRKDPFLGGESITSNVEAKSSTDNWDYTTSFSDKTTCEYAVRNPMRFIIRNSNNEDWYYTGTSYTDDTRWQRSNETKGKYDPCPYGWRVPDGGPYGLWSTAFGISSNWETSKWDTTNKGIDFGQTEKPLGSGQIWYPAAGERSLSLESTPIIDVGYCGCYWSSSPNGMYGHTLISYDGYVFSSYWDSRANGHSVRCVKDYHILTK